MFTTPALAERLRDNVEGPVRFDALTRGLYSTDASIYQIEPLGVVLPRTLEDIDAIMAIAREDGVPVLPRGAGTSQCGQAIGRALVVDTSRYLRRVAPVDREARTVWVEPGVVLDRLNRRLAPTGLFFPVDVATANRATIGGMAGNNSGGARSIRYGIMADNVLAIEAALPDGRVAGVRRGPARIAGGRASRWGPPGSPLRRRHPSGQRGRPRPDGPGDRHARSRRTGAPRAEGPPSCGRIQPAPAAAPGRLRGRVAGRLRGYPGLLPQDQAEAVAQAGAADAGRVRLPVAAGGARRGAAHRQTGAPRRRADGPQTDRAGA